jgi:hypothetical protein
MPRGKIKAVLANEITCLDILRLMQLNGMHREVKHDQFSSSKGRLVPFCQGKTIASGMIIPCDTNMY